MQFEATVKIYCDSRTERQVGRGATPDCRCLVHQCFGRKALSAHLCNDKHPNCPCILPDTTGPLFCSSAFLATGVVLGRWVWNIIVKMKPLQLNRNEPDSTYFTKQTTQVSQQTELNTIEAAGAVISNLQH